MIVVQVVMFSPSPISAHMGTVGNGSDSYRDPPSPPPQALAGEAQSVEILLRSLSTVSEAIMAGASLTVGTQQ